MLLLFVLFDELLFICRW